MNRGTLPPQMLVARARGGAEARELAELLKSGDFGADTSLLQEALRAALEDGPE